MEGITRVLGANDNMVGIGHLELNPEKQGSVVLLWEWHCVAAARCVVSYFLGVQNRYLGAFGSKVIPPKDEYKNHNCCATNKGT